MLITGSTSREINECHTWSRRSWWCDNGNQNHWKSIPMKNANVIVSRHSYFEAHYIMWLILKPSFAALISKARNFSASPTQTIRWLYDFFPFRIAYEKKPILEGNEITAQSRRIWQMCWNYKFWTRTEGEKLTFQMISERRKVPRN